MEHDETAQLSYRCRLEWGRAGVQRAAARHDIVVIVDTLRFSTAVVAAVQRGALVYPCLDPEEAGALRERRMTDDGHLVALPTHEALSPRAYQDILPETRVLLPSPNGATCTRYGAGAPLLLIGALVNAAAVSEALTTLLDGTELGVTVVACGERRKTPDEDGSLRMAIEDYLGAGAILSSLSYSKSAEATVCQTAFEGTRDRVAKLLRESVSGQELEEKGLGRDVEYAAQLNRDSAVPVLDGEWLMALHPQHLAATSSQISRQVRDIRGWIPWPLARESGTTV